jgi:hypothetical protein
MLSTKTGTFKGPMNKDFLRLSDSLHPHLNNSKQAYMMTKSTWGIAG